MCRGPPSATYQGPPTVTECTRCDIIAHRNRKKMRRSQSLVRRHLRSHKQTRNCLRLHLSRSPRIPAAASVPTNAPTYHNKRIPQHRTQTPPYAGRSHAHTMKGAHTSRRKPDISSSIACNLSPPPEAFLAASCRASAAAVLSSANASSSDWHRISKSDTFFCEVLSSEEVEASSSIAASFS